MENNKNPEPQEEWRDIEGYEGYYQVSNLGRVKSLARAVKKQWFLKHIRERIMRPGLEDKGYQIVVLRINNSRQTIRVHKLVAQAFIPNPNNLPQVNHKDCNRSNNRVDNLEWCTAAYNVTYADAIEKRRAQIVKPVRVLNPDGSLFGDFDCPDSAASAIGLKCRDTIYRNISGFQKNRQGYIIKYI